jgi:hypothetical protein
LGSKGTYNTRHYFLTFVSDEVLVEQHNQLLHHHGRHSCDVGAELLNNCLFKTMQAIYITVTKTSKMI